MPQAHEVDERLSKVDDSRILLNFASALDAVFPHLVEIDADRSDPFDDVSEHLFWLMVFKVMQWKYGIELPENDCARYEFSYDYYAPLNFISVLVPDEPDSLFALIGFGDGKRLRSSETDSKGLHFDGFHSACAYRLDSRLQLASPDVIWFRRDQVSYQLRLRGDGT